MPRRGSGQITRDSLLRRFRRPRVRAGCQVRLAGYAYAAAPACRDPDHSQGPRSLSVLAGYEAAPDYKTRPEDTISVPGFYRGETKHLKRIMPQLLPPVPFL